MIEKKKNSYESLKIRNLDKIFSKRQFLLYNKIKPEYSKNVQCSKIFKKMILFSFKMFCDILGVSVP